MARKGGVGSSEATRRLLALAERQHGVVATRQLRRMGVSWEQVRDRKDSGWLRRVHQGVYVLTGREGCLTRWMAAVIACGPRAVLSHVDAAALWGLAGQSGDLNPAKSPVNVSVPADAIRRRRDGIALHRVQLAAADTTVHERIPVTTTPRTILDVAARVGRRQLERMIDEVERLRLCKDADFATMVERNRRAAGAARLAHVIDRHAPGSTLTRSELEERFLCLCREHHLPQPLVNAPLLGLTVDFLWPPALVVEVDGAASHLTRRAFQDDRDRDSLLVSNGYRVLRFTWRDVMHRPAVVVQRIRRALSL
jgi:very-short-patch-repair endonuclease/predicted transcriptional regulator of viral defense system